ncbi:MAG: hypothetical protein ABIY37_13340 [Devosia sp.]
MQAATVFFILYALTGEATLTPIAQYDSKESCQVVEGAMNAVIGSASLGNAKFTCLDGQTLIEMLDKNGVDTH